MWEWLRGNQTGVHFRGQAVDSGRILDFYSGLVRVAVEVDGRTHAPDRDRERDDHPVCSLPLAPIREAYVTKTSRGAHSLPRDGFA